MLLDAVFSHQKTYPITFSVKQETEQDGQIIDSSETDILSCKGIFYRGSISQSYKSDKFKSDVSATIIIKPKDLTVTIPEGAKASIEGVGAFSVMFVDDVAGQGLVIIIPCKEVTPNG